MAEAAESLAFAAARTGLGASSTGTGGTRHGFLVSQPQPFPVARSPTVTDAVSWWSGWLFSDAPFRLLGIVAFAAVLNWALSRLIKRVVARTAASTNRERRGEDSAVSGLLRERREQRANAIGQLVRSVLAVIIWSSAVLMIMPIFGIDITPLLASAGVIGVALGFGAQTLVKDYLSASS